MIGAAPTGSLGPQLPDYGNLRGICSSREILTESNSLRQVESPIMQKALSEAMASLASHRESALAETLAEEFTSDPKRFQRFHVILDDLLFDFSKQRINARTIALLASLAKAAEIEAKRDAMFRGDIVNTTERRAALHTALRDTSERSVMVDGRNVAPDILGERSRMLAFAADVRDGRLRGASGQPITEIVNIGIGGSDLGPAMATRALSPYIPSHLQAHFVSNVDGSDIADSLRGLNPAQTLFIISSKTFTTQETMTNAATARDWIVGSLGVTAVSDHFAAVSTRPDKVSEFGIDSWRTFGFWDWVGGRYSIWSSIGLPLAIAIGPSHFEDFLRGAHDVDEHFRQSIIDENIPMLMGLISIWNRNFLGYASQAIIPYDQRLARFPAYLQQLNMESNGKSVDLDGERVSVATGPIVWGEPGTNGQHAFFQLLHQGTEIAPIDFLLAAKPTHADCHHHDLLVANCLAQGEALMRGRSLAEAEKNASAMGASKAEAIRLAPHKAFPGSRPSSTFLYAQLNPRTLGRLIALYEHKVFVEAAIWNINPFDQWGVELGKELASRLAPIVAEAHSDLSALDSSTAGLIAHLRKLRS